jgi:CIC family chloride channel protein
MTSPYRLLYGLLERFWTHVLGHGTGRWLLLGGIVGMLCGAAGFVFELAVNLVSALLLGVGVGLPLHLEGPWVPLPAGTDLRWFLIPPVLMIGGALSGWLSGAFAHDAAGGGTGVAVLAFHRHRGRISPRTTLTKMAASAVTLGSGGSAGREGPIALVGAGFGAWFASRAGLSVPDRRTLLVAGIAGGVAAIFHAPLAAALFAAEVLYRGPDLEADVLMPAFISSIVGFVTAGLLVGAWNGLCGHPVVLTSSLFQVPAGLGFGSGDWPQLIGYLAIAVAVAFGARLFIACYKGFGAWSGRVFASSVVRGAVGAGLTGVLCVALLLTVSRWAPEAPKATSALLGPGYGLVQGAIERVTPDLWWAALLALLALGKILATAFTVGSGCSGGIFAPSLVIGGALAGAVGAALHGTIFAPPPAAAVVIGMAAFLAVTHRTPVAALLMVSEVTGTYGLLIPAMWVVGISWLLLGERTAIPQQERSPWKSPAHHGHGFQDLFVQAKVAEALPAGGALDVATLAPGDNLEACRARVADSRQHLFPVVQDDRLVGMVRLDDLRAHLYAHDLDEVVAVTDLMDGPAAALKPDDTLARALRRFAQHGVEELPVVDATGRFLGLLPRQALFDHYQRAVRALAEGSEAPSADLADWRRRTATGSDLGRRTTDSDIRLPGASDRHEIPRP